jgi:hypothetical protein
MSQMTRSNVEPLCAAAFGLRVAKSHSPDSRTLRSQWLLDTVLPGVALLSMSVLTVTMIVVVVTTVAHGGWLTPGTYVSIDPWTSVYPGPANLRRDDILYPDVVTGQGPLQSDPSFDAQAQAGGAGYFAAQTAE